MVFQSLHFFHSPYQLNITLKEWLVLKTEDGSTQMVSAKLVSRTKPQPQQSTNTNNSGGNSSTTQPPASNGGSSGGQPSGGGDPGSAPIGGGMFSGILSLVHRINSLLCHMQFRDLLGDYKQSQHTLSGLPVSGGYDPNVENPVYFE